MLIALAGLPGTGKSRLGRALAKELPASILDKDVVRAALFQPRDIEYSTSQDDFVVSLLFQTAAYLAHRDPRQVQILDGRPFARRYQRADLVRFTSEQGIPLCLIECVCSDETARRRLEGRRASTHLARNRNFTLYRRLKAEFEPIEEQRLLMVTDRPFPVCVATALAYVREHMVAAGLADDGFASR